MRKKENVHISTFVCSECGEKTPLPRYGYREKNHIKTMWCYKCKKITDFTEIRHFESERQVKIKVTTPSKFDEELNKLKIDEEGT